MSGNPRALVSAIRRAYGLGLALGLGLPALVAGIMLSGRVAPGDLGSRDLLLQVGYLFTGLLFLGAAWVVWRRGKVLAAFKALPEEHRPGAVLREVLLYSAILAAGSLLGLAYWRLAGLQAARHAWGFVLISPGLCLALVPRPKPWMKALEGEGYAEAFRRGEGA